MESYRAEPSQKLPIAFFFEIYIDDMSLLGVVINGILYWTAQGISKLLGYKRVRKLLYHMKCLPKIGQLLPGRVLRLRKLQSTMNMISHEDVLSSIFELKNTKDFVVRYMRIFEEPLSCSLRMDTFLQKPSLTHEYVPAFSFHPDGDIYLKELIKKLVNIHPPVSRRWCQMTPSKINA
ncbi:hypothetical protein AVEN_143808-1, partial [Araneus ventricosus]